MEESQNLRDFIFALVKIHNALAFGKDARAWQMKADNLFAKLSREERDMAHEIRRKLFH